MSREVYLRRARLGALDETAATIEELFGLLPATKRLTPQSRVLIKPNLLAKHGPDAAVTTHPEVLRGVILALQKRGVTDITVADSPGGTYTPGGMESVYKVCGLAAVCEQTGAKLYTACESGSKDTAQTPNQLVRQFTVLNPVLESDFIINLPKLKTHVMTYMSGAVKNLFGCVPGLQKAEFHMRFPERAHFGQMLVDLCETVAADIHIVDGILGMEGDGPAGGNPRDTGLLIAGENPYTVDLALCHIMGLEPMKAPMLEAAAENGLCERQLDTGLLQGDEELKQPIAGYKAPSSYGAPMNFMGAVPKLFHPLLPAITSYVAPRPVIVKKQCIGCGKCAEICPQRVIKIEDGKAIIRYSGCIRCFCCHEMCPVKAIDVKRRRLFGL